MRIRDFAHLKQPLLELAEKLVSDSAGDQRFEIQPDTPPGRLLAGAIVEVEAKLKRKVTHREQEVVAFITLKAFVLGATYQTVSDRIGVVSPGVTATIGPGEVQ